MKRCEIHDTPMQESVIVPGLHRCRECEAKINLYLYNRAMDELLAPRTPLEPMPGLVLIPNLDDELDPGEKAEFPENFIRQRVHKERPRRRLRVSPLRSVRSTV